MSDGAEHQTNSVYYGAGLQAPAAPAKDGYSFSGWYENADFSGSAFSFENSPTMPAGNLTLYAKWTPRDDTVYTVEHYKQLADGLYSETPDDIDTLKGTTDATVTASPKDYQHYTLDEGALGAIESGKVLADGSLVLKLYYARNTYTLTFENHDGTVISSTPVRHGAPISAPAPTVGPGPGYDLGWSPAVPAVMPTENATYQAVWTPKDGINYSIVYYWQNAEDDGYTPETVYGTGTTGTSIIAPEKDDPRFVENTNHAGCMVEGVIAGDGSLVLRRYYDRVTYNVTFNAGGGTLTDSAEKTFRHGQKLKISDPTRSEDYAFDGWYDEYGTKYDANYEVTGALNLTARWKAGAVNYTVEHYIMDTDGGYSETATYTETKSGIVDDEIRLSILVNESYEVENGIFFSLSKVGDEETASTTIKRGMTVKLYYVRYAHHVEWELSGGVAGGGSYPSTVFYKKAMTLPTPAKTGHTFAGWYTDEALKNVFTGEMPAANLTLYAKWTVNEYTITFNTAGGTALEPLTFNYNAPVTIHPNPTRLGYTFAGWDKAVPETMPAENVTLTAQWDVMSYTTSYTLDGGAAEGNLDSYTVENSITLKNPTRLGYEFLGWTGTDIGDKPSLNVIIPKGSTENRAYTAHWQLNTYTITYTLGGGAAEGNSGSYTVESEPVTLKEPARNGYTFTGWTGTGIGSTPTKNVTVPISGFANHLSLTANWSAIPYTITYNDVDGATNSNPSDYTIESSFVLTAPEKDGYVFLGWTGTGIAGSTPKLDVTITSGTTGPLVFTAHWQVSDFKIRSVADLIKLRDQVSSGTWGERTAILETDLQLPVDWEGIGSGQNPFTGVFDGNNHTITYNGSDTAYQNAPLFRTNSGTIENLKITIQGVVRVNGSFGAVTVANSKGTIRNCHVAPADDTDSRIVQNNSQGTLGGVVADNSGDSSVAGKIINCSVGRSASSPLVLEREGNMFTGGVVGANTGSTLGSFPPPALIEYTTAFVNPFSNDAGIYVKFITKAEGSTPGGIAGYNTRAKIQFGKSVNIYASFKAESQMQYLGGIAGSTSTVEIIGPGPGTYVNVTCNVESSHDKVYVGGIAGSSWSISGRYIHVNPMDLSDLKSGVCDINQNTLFMEGDYIGLVGFFEYIKGPESYYDVFGSYYG